MCGLRLNEYQLLELTTQSESDTLIPNCLLKSEVQGRLRHFCHRLGRLHKQMDPWYCVSTVEMVGNVMGYQPLNYSIRTSAFIGFRMVIE